MPRREMVKLDGAVMRLGSFCNATASPIAVLRGGMQKPLTRSKLLQFIKSVLTDNLDRLLTFCPVRFFLHPSGVVVVGVPNETTR